jgi:hypothetical protein
MSGNYEDPYWKARLDGHINLLGIIIEDLERQLKKYKKMLSEAKKRR